MGGLLLDSALSLASQLAAASPHSGSSLLARAHVTASARVAVKQQRIEKRLQRTRVSLSLLLLLPLPPLLISLCVQGGSGSLVVVSNANLAGSEMEAGPF